MDFPNLQQLEDLTLTQLKNLPITTSDQEQQVQKILDSRIRAMPSQQKVYRGDVPFEIKTKEEELKWQAILDEREAKIKEIGKSEEQVLETKVAELEVAKVVLEKELNVKPRFCEFCTSKGHFHKADCTRIK